MDAIGPKAERRSCHRQHPISRGRRGPACDTRGGISHIQNECEDRCCLEITPPSAQGWLEEASLLRVRLELGSVSIAPKGEEASSQTRLPRCAIGKSMNAICAARYAQLSGRRPAFS